MLRVAWIEKRTNKVELGIKQRSAATCSQQFLKFFGHILRRQGDNLEKLIVEGKVEGESMCDQSPKGWLDQLGE